MLQEEKAELDTWGVWDRWENEWVEGYTDWQGYHERQNLNYNHAVNAANKMNGYGSQNRYIARDMMAEKSCVEDYTPKTNIAQEIVKREQAMSILQEEIDALRRVQKILGD